MESPAPGPGTDLASSVDIMLLLRLSHSITHLYNGSRDGAIIRKDLDLLLVHGVERVCHIHGVIKKAGKQNMVDLIDLLSKVPEDEKSQVYSYILGIAPSRVTEQISKSGSEDGARSNFGSFVEASPEANLGQNLTAKRKTLANSSKRISRPSTSSPTTTDPATQLSSKMSHMVVRDSGNHKGRQEKHCPECRKPRCYRFRSHIEACLPELKGLDSTSNTLIACGYCAPAAGYQYAYQGKAFFHNDYEHHIEDHHSGADCLHWGLNLAMNNILTHGRLAQKYREYLHRKEAAQRKLIWARSEETTSLLKRLQSFVGSHSALDATPTLQIEVGELLESAYALAGKVDPPPHSWNISQQTLDQHLPVLPDYQQDPGWIQFDYQMSSDHGLLFTSGQAGIGDVDNSGPGSYM